MTHIHKHGGKSSESMLDKDAILKKLKISAGQNIFDAGCGNGYMSKEFSKLAGTTGTIYAIDDHKHSIKKLKGQVEGTNIKVISGDITKKTEIDDSSIDLVYLSNVFHGFTPTQVRDFLLEIKRILKPNGILAVLEINKDDTPFGPPVDIKYSPEELVKAVDLESETLTKIGEHFYMQTFVYKK